MVSAYVKTMFFLFCFVFYYDTNDVCKLASVLSKKGKALEWEEPDWKK